MQSTYEKSVVADKVKKDKDDDKKFKIEAAGTGEEDIEIVFQSEDDAKKAKKIDKLGIVNLPTDGAGVTGIVWINNFWLKKDDDKYLDGVIYRLRLPDHPSKTLVYHDGTGVIVYQGTKTRLGNGQVEIELGIGDPAIGWGGGG